MPTISTINPATFDDGRNVTLTGAGFGSSQGSVLIGGVGQNVNTWSDTSITFTTVRGSQSLGACRVDVIAGVSSGYTPTVIVTNQTELNTELAKSAAALEGQVIGVQYNATPYTIGTGLNNKNFGAAGLVICTYGATSAVFSAMSLSATQKATFHNLTFYATSATGGDAVALSACANITIQNSTLYADKYAKASGSAGYPYSFDGVDATYCTNLTIDGCRIYNVFRGVTFDNCAGTTVRGSYITPQAGTAIQVLGNNTTTVIERNHIEGQSFVAYPTDIDAFLNPHQSVISIRSSGVTIRQNFCHGLGTSSGIMCYDPDVSGGQDPYTNIVIENNVVYDVKNNTVVRIYKLGTGFVVRNNLFAGNLRTGSCGDGATSDRRYRYETAFRIESLGTGISDASGLALHNNIMVGITDCPLTVTESNNWCWSWSVGTTFYSASPSGASTVNVSTFGGCGTAPTTAEDTTFFKVAHNYTFPAQTIEDWTLAAGSVGIDFGNSSNQPSNSLGTVIDGYVQNNGIARSVSANDVGPYQT